MSNNNARKQQSRGYGNASARAAPAAKSSKFSNAVPSVSRRGDSYMFSHRERVLDINVDTTDAYGVFRINPGLSKLFPWLSEQSGSWEMYQFTKLHFEYVASCPTSTSGQVIMAIDYDPYDAAPGSADQLGNYYGSAQGPLWDSLSVKCNIDYANGAIKRRWIRDSADAADLRTSDVGTFFIWTTASGAAIVSGTLYVSYDVRFFIPQLAGSVKAGKSLIYEVAADTTCATGSNEYWGKTGDVSVVELANTLDASINATNGEITLPVGRYLIDAVTTVSDSIAELLNVHVHLYQYLSGVDTKIGDFYQQFNGTAGGAIQATLLKVIEVTASNTALKLATYVSGAAGVLTLKGINSGASSSYLKITPI